MTGNKPESQQRTRIQKLSWALLLAMPLIPSLQEGVSPIELLSLMLPLIACLVLLLLPVERNRLNPVLLLLPTYLALSFLSLTHDPPKYFLTNFAAGLLFTLCAYVGATASASTRKLMVYWIFAQLFAGATIDILLDFSGWSSQIAPTKDWEIGERGVMASRSNYGVNLAPFALWIAISARRQALRYLGVLGLFLTFYHVVVFGQGRGGTLLASLGIIGIIMKGRRAGTAVLFAILPLIALSSLGLLDEAVAPLSQRVDSEKFTEVDRFEQIRVGLRLLTQMDTEEVLTGLWYRKILVANSGLSMHNAPLDTLTRFGLVAGTPFLIFFAILGLRAFTHFGSKKGDGAYIIAHVSVLQLLVALNSAGLFANWRIIVVPGLCCGLSLSKLRERTSRNNAPPDNRNSRL